VSEPPGLWAVHLVRIGEPLASLERFATSYERHPAGVEHRLAILYKGFVGDEDALAPYRAAVAALRHDELHVSDEGFDLTAYATAGAQLDADRYLFLNSHSEIVCDGWLALLDAAHGRSEVGIAGATGSWASHASLARFFLRLPSPPYSGLLGSPGHVSAILSSLATRTGEEVAAPGAARSFSRRVVNGLANLPDTMRLMRSCERFPAFHVRTNAFLIGRELLAGLTGFTLDRKLDALALEGGRHSITSQVEARGLKAVVADRFGGVWERERWAQSETFWQGEQRGLIVADNQTRLYADGDAERRRLLARYAWGELAEPGRG
jgi:hypothetical protein